VIVSLFGVYHFVQLAKPEHYKLGAKILAAGLITSAILFVFVQLF
jgi:hypothetical protein